MDVHGERSQSFYVPSSLVFYFSHRDRSKPRESMHEKMRDKLPAHVQLLLNPTSMTHDSFNIRKVYGFKHISKCYYFNF